jgi:hypothetical protein
VTSRFQSRAKAKKPEFTDHAAQNETAGQPAVAIRRVESSATG